MTEASDRTGLTEPAGPWHVLALPPLAAGVLEVLFGGPEVSVDVPSTRAQSALLEGIASADIVVGDWSGTFRVDAEAVAAASRLAFVQQPSAGVDSLDVEALTAAGVTVANIGDANAVSVAEWCVGASFAVLRSLAHADAEVRAGRWPQVELTHRGGGELSGRRVGLIGMGNIGREAAARFAALGCDVAHWSRRERPAAEAGGARWLALPELLSHAEVLVVVVALAPQTRGLLDTERLALLPPGAIVVNAARGGIVDESALLAAITSGAIAGAALDVYDVEPLPADSPLRSDDRILLSPHAAGSTPQSISRLIDVVTANVRLAVAGRPVQFVVNGGPALIQRR